MESINQIYKKAMSDNAPYIAKGLMTMQESDMIAKRNAIKVHSAQCRVLNSLVGMIL